ncbi:MAG: hypothetical protein ABIP39_00750 [Polyangiaceae bacterium]
MKTIRKVSSALFVVLALAALHCGGATTADPIAADGGGADGSTPGVPDKHRPTAPTCATSRGPQIPDAGMADSGISGSCAVDADCTEGKNGRCGPSTGNRAGNYCSYDACFVDGDCAAGEACTCGPSGNACVPAGCRIDADCGVGGYCSPTTGGGCGGASVTGYYCHTASDECANDADCKATHLGESCAWTSTVKKWTCQPLTVCAG